MLLRLIGNRASRRQSSGDDDHHYPVVQHKGFASCWQFDAGSWYRQLFRGSESGRLNLKLLEHAGAWTSPGVSTEFMDLYLAPYSVADRVSAGGGLASEHEAISVLEMPIPELWRLVELQQLKDLKTLALVLLLRAYHPHLFRVPV
jgi:hypothetical protein